MNHPITIRRPLPDGSEWYRCIRRETLRIGVGCGDIIEFDRVLGSGETEEEADYYAFLEVHKYSRFVG